MNKKKEFTTDMKIMISAVKILIICVILFVLIHIGIEHYKFNPNEDVCEEYGDKYVKFPPEECKRLKIAYSKSDCLTESDKQVLRWCEQCKSWRPKTLCEKDPNHEDCECDEYESKTYCIGGSSVHCKLIGYHNKRNFSVECESDCTGEIEIRQECTKVHLKNECEKGNEDWVWDYGDNITEVCFEGKCGLCYEKIDKHGIRCIKPICRKKTIKDLSCERLKELILLKDCEGELNKETCFRLGFGFDRLDNAYILELLDRCI